MNHKDSLAALLDVETGHHLPPYHSRGMIGRMDLSRLRPIPSAPQGIQKGSNLRELLGPGAIACLAHNLALVCPSFSVERFRRDANDGLAPLGIMQRGQHLANVLRVHLPERFDEATDVLLRSVGPAPADGTETGLAVFFYLPHVTFIGTFGLDAAGNGGRDPFDVSMRAQRELTKRFTAEFSIRAFLLKYQDRTLIELLRWTRDPNASVRRLCSEGTRPRLPWARRIPPFVSDPSPALPILEALRDDPELYVRRSVANHIGDIAKDHPAVAFQLCERWLEGATTERKWLIRHALRHPAKKGVRAALRLRKMAKG